MMDVSDALSDTPVLLSGQLSHGISAHHFQLHRRSVRELRPIIEFEYSEVDEREITLTLFGSERPGLLADITEYLKSTSLQIRHANIHSLEPNAIMDQFIIYDADNILQDDKTVSQIHDTLINIIVDANYLFFLMKDENIRNNEGLYNYQLLNHHLPLPMLPPSTKSPFVTNRISSNIALRELEEEHRLEYEATRRQSQAVTANYVEHALSSLINGEYLYYYSSHIRYRHKFCLSEDKKYLSWGDSNQNVVRLSRYAGCLFGPKSSVFQDLRYRLVDPDWLCFSLVAKPLPTTANQTASKTTPNTIDLVCVSVDQLNRWFLGLQSCCSPSSFSTYNSKATTASDMQYRLTLSDITKQRVIYKIRAYAHARGLTVRRYVLKRVRELGLRRNSQDIHRQYTDEIRHLQAELGRVQKNLIDYARRETLLTTSLKDFQTSWSIDPADVRYLHPIGRGAFSEMWKAMWRSTPVAVKCLTTHSFTHSHPGNIPLEIAPGKPQAPQIKSSVPNTSPSTGKSKNNNAEQSQNGLSAEDRRLLQDFRLEVTMLNRLRHPNIVLFLGAVTQLPKLSILTEFCHGGSLFNALRKRSWRTCVSLQDLRLVARHIARGVCYLHANNIIHRDLKSQNLLLDRPVDEGCPVIKVADFGLSRNFNKLGVGTVHTTGSVAGVMTSETGTYRWMAPEMIRHEPYNEKVDVYSYGVVLWELFSCEIPFHSLSPIQAAYAVADKHVRPKCDSKTVEIPVAWERLIQQCWHRSSHQRPRFNQVLDILDEMESCNQDEIPPSLQRHQNRHQQPRQEKPDTDFNLSNMYPLPFSVRAESTGEPSNGKFDPERNVSLTRNDQQTGLRRSGSSPAVAKLFTDV